MANPFDDPHARFHVLVNAEGQHSLWPAAAAVPAGWAQVHSGAQRECLEHIESRWRDMRPRSLRAAVPRE